MVWQDRRFLLLLLCLQNGICTAGGGDVLDSYGNAVALQHAAAAADGLGRRRIVLAWPSSAIWILSPAVELPPGYRQRPFRPFEYRIAPSSYLIATGVAPDVIWLRQQLRSYYKHVQERYIGVSSTNPSVSFAMVTSLLLRQFWDEANETYMPVGYQLLLQEAGEDRPFWGRPLGLRCLLIQWNGLQFCLDEFDPSGSIVRTSRDNGKDELQVFCMGPNSEVLRDELTKLRTQLQEASSRQGNLEALLAQALAPHGASWQLEILTPVDGAISIVDQRILPASKGL
jgi:hypothetical protein